MILDDFKGYIFDLDGTLVDSFGVWNTVDRLFLSKRGFAVPENYGKEVSAMGFDSAAEYTIKRFGLNEKKSDIIDEWNETATKLFENEVFLFEGVREYLIKLKKKGKKLGIATASHRGLTDPCLKNNDVLELFDSIVTVYDVNRGKDFPDIYLKAADEMGLKSSECVVFEDVPKAIRGAKLGGFKTVAFISYGNIYDSEELIRVSDKYIEGYNEL